MSDLDSEIKAVEEQAKGSVSSVSDAIQRQQAGDRSFIARTVIFTFLGLVAVVVAAAIVGAYLFDWSYLVEPGKYLVTLLSSVLLPIVTLVIGYYFGSK